MKNGPDIARVAALIGDPARANILTALMAGKALTASELASEAGVTAQTASSHLKRLLDGGLLRLRGQGRHRYYALSGPDVAATLESLMGLAAGHGHLRTRTGPKDAKLREARVCYNHLAGTRGVQMYRSMIQRGFLTEADDLVKLTDQGRAFVAEFGIDLSTPTRSKAPLCLGCLDWSARETHLAGRLGRAMFAHMEQRDWIQRTSGSRHVQFSAAGHKMFEQWFPV
ncbi:helix-turn-helix transcriptional regulator [Tropicibacter sp. R16_0]|uniref:ArsR/SmtB family transcription factor n=1 Tax=Tropicibacter sp. R16_0 TaxID=2821102 RepID=UPI001ADAAC35|nr:helix-turn-helix transcriptional regulator [Tropicibacter sp. R16_0]MBO9451842.1 helix-turn-helix transcriptional regulator [Tropicibacter sp. R16_0]